MKKISIALGLAAASLLSTHAMAQTYVSVGAGLSNVDSKCPAGVSCDKRDTAFKITGGYRFGDGLSAELGYINFGKAKFTTDNGSGSIKPSALTIGGAYALALDKNWALNTRLGLAQSKSQLGTSGDLVATGNGSNNSTSVYFGFGVAYAIDQNLKVEAGADFARGKVGGEKINLQAYTLGASYDF